MKQSKVFIFDLDGTLANLDHRLHLVKGEKKDYDTFHALCTEDVPIENNIDIVRIAARNPDNTIIISSGRSDIVREQTVKWLNDNQVPYDHLYMRPHGDYTPDDKLKQSWLHGGMFGDKDNVSLVLDDRPRVVRMWEAEGLPVVNVGSGVEF